jgi:integrase
LIVGKRGKVRRIVLTAAAVSLIGEGSGKVLPLAPNSIYHRVRQLGKRAGIPWVHPHVFRHSFSVFWMLETQDMESLRTLAGWSDNSSMPRHYARMALEESAVIKAKAVNLDLFAD